MELKLKRSQRMSGLMTKKPVFMLDARIDLNREESDLVRKYGLGDYAIYDSSARQQAASNAMDHAQAAQASGSVGGAMFRLGRAYLSAAMAKMSLRVTVNSLVAGQHIECKDLEELLGAEQAIRDAANNMKGYLEVAQTFDGREEVVAL